MRIVLDPEEALELAREPVMQELLRYADPFTISPYGLPLAIGRLRLVALLQSPRWMRPRGSVRVDADPPGRPVVREACRVHSALEAQEWEDAFRRAAHHRRLLAGDITYGSVAWPAEPGSAVLVVADDGFIRSRTALVAGDDGLDVLMDCALVLAGRMHAEMAVQATSDVHLSVDSRYAGG